jgi:hypothetical protein
MIEQHGTARRGTERMPAFLGTENICNVRNWVLGFELYLAILQERDETRQVDGTGIGISR